MTSRKQHDDRDFFTFGGLLSILLIWWGLEGVDQLVLSGRLDQWGIYPRSIDGLIGIPLAPFLHGDFSHVLANSFPFLFLGYIVLKAEKKNFYKISTIIVMIGGLGTWLIGRESLHIGASGLIYGYFGYVMFRGLSERRVKWILVALIVGVFFGGMIWGVLPSVGGHISWEGHLCGMLAGGWLGRKKAVAN